LPELIELTWEASGHHKMVSSRDRGPFRYAAFVPDPISDLDPSLSAGVAAAIERAVSACTHLDTSPGIQDLEPVARLLLRAESVASSRIEGLRLSHRRIEEARFAPEGARGTALSIVRNIDAMSRAIELGMRPDALAVDDLLSIHAALMHTPEDLDIAGKVRDRQNWIGGGNTPRRAEFVPPPPDRVPSLLEDLMRFCSRDDTSAVVQAAIAHAQFETIHPFEDGNGRTGRCLIHLILRRRAVSERVVPPVSVVLAADARHYVEGLTSYRTGDVETWCGDFADALTVAGERAVDLGREMTVLRESWLERAGRPNRGSTARRVIEGLSGHPIVSVESAARFLGVSDEAARTALNRLERADVLHLVTVGRRNRAWAAIEVFELLDEFDATIGVRGRPTG
jgi:Fic family protein